MRVITAFRSSSIFMANKAVDMRGDVLRKILQRSTKRCFGLSKRDFAKSHAISTGRGVTF